MDENIIIKYINSLNFIPLQLTIESSNLKCTCRCTKILKKLKLPVITEINKWLAEPLSPLKTKPLVFTRGFVVFRLDKKI